MNTATSRRVSTQRIEDLLRLANQAEQKGVKILLTADGEHLATSISNPTMLHRVSERGCDCRGYQAWHRCMHHSLLLAELGRIPDPEPVVTAVVIEPASCRSCRGVGYIRAYVGGGLSDWIAVPCVCREVTAAA